MIGAIIAVAMVRRDGRWVQYNTMESDGGPMER